MVVARGKGRAGGAVGREDRRILLGDGTDTFFVKLRSGEEGNSCS